MLTTAVEGKGCVLGISRRELDDGGFRDLVRKALAAQGLDEEAPAGRLVRPLCALRAGGRGRGGGLHAHPGADRGHRGGLQATRQPGLLPGAAATGLRPDDPGPGRDGARTEGPGWTRIVIEKPFGHDLKSAQALNELAHEVFDESQIYRIDHYLGKQTVQNLLVFRFANAMFESLWNRDRIERVEITVAESLGVEGRGGYYDRSGAVARHDPEPPHAAADPHGDGGAHHLPRPTPSGARRSRSSRACSPSSRRTSCSGSTFGARRMAKCCSAIARRRGVPPDSRTETFAALKVEVANWRWQGVPFFLRTGKRMEARSTRIAVRFRRAPVSIFEDVAHMRRVAPNVLLITLQPDEGFDLFFEVKAPSEPFHLDTRRLDFRYDEAFGALPDAYETLLLDVVTGDQTLFVHAEEVEAELAALRARARAHPLRRGAGPALRGRQLGGPVAGALLDQWTWAHEGGEGDESSSALG